MSKGLCLRVRLKIGLSALVLIVIAMSASSYVSVRKLSTLSDFADKKSDGKALVLTVDDILNRQRSEYRAFLLTNQNDYITSYTEDNHRVAETFEKLDAVLTTAEGRAMKTRLMESVQRYHQLIEREVALSRSGQRNAAIALMMDPQSGALRRELDKNMADLLDRQVQRKLEARQAQHAIESRTITMMVSLAILGVALASLISLLVSRSVTCSLRPIIVNIHEIAANNLSSADVHVAPGDEIGIAAGALNRMKNNLRKVVKSISSTAEHVASASEEISSSARQQAQSAQTQEEQAAQVATAMQQMSSTVMEVSANSNKAAEASRQAAETARKGGTIVEETLRQMRAMAESVGGIARKVAELGKNSEQIGRIIGVIDDIADQTNLLALNAAIEAARAGEQGRGFAVVADEVRKLAERTTTATKEIAQMIKTIQDETRTAVSAMQQGTRQVEQGVGSTAKAGEALREIIAMSEQVGEMITHIATAATEQSSATEEVNRNMDQIARLVKEASLGAQESAKACHSLSGLAFDLQKMVSEFTVDGAETSPCEYGEHTDDRPKAFAAISAS